MGRVRAGGRTPAVGVAPAGSRLLASVRTQRLCTGRFSLRSGGETVRAGSERKPLPHAWSRLRCGSRSCRTDLCRRRGSHPVGPEPSARLPRRRAPDGKGTKGKEEEGKGTKGNERERKGRNRARREQKGRKRNETPSFHRGSRIGLWGELPAELRLGRCSASDRFPTRSRRPTPPPSA